MNSKNSFHRLVVAGSLAALTASAWAGNRTFNFDTDPSAELQIFGNNPAVYVGTGGNPDTGGYISITDAVTARTPRSSSPTSTGACR